jgi:hypothetical protein
MAALSETLFLLNRCMSTFEFLEEISYLINSQTIRVKNICFLPRSVRSPTLNLFCSVEPKAFCVGAEDRVIYDKQYQHCTLCSTTDECPPSSLRRCLFVLVRVNDCFL